MPAEKAVTMNTACLKSTQLLIDKKMKNAIGNKNQTFLSTGE